MHLIIRKDWDSNPVEEHDGADITWRKTPEGDIRIDITPPRVQVLHMRDPDSECGLWVFLDGVHIDTISVTDVDPGRGYEADYIAEVRQTWAEAAAAPDATEWDRAVARAHAEADYEGYQIGL